MIFLTSQVIDVLKQDGCPVGDKEIAFRLNENINVVKETLLVLQRENRIVQTSSGRWEIVMAMPKPSPGDRSKGSRKSRPWGTPL